MSRSGARRAPLGAEHIFRAGLAEASQFLERFGTPLDFKGKRVLDYGCGYGSLSFHVSEHERAAAVIGVDIDEDAVAFAQSKLRREFGNLSDVVDFTFVEELSDESFDIVVSKNAFQHYSDPDKALHEMTKRLAPGGMLLIGFGPLWKSPFGAPIGFMTKLPWAHLLFPESVIMHRRRLFRPDEPARFYHEIRGGFNKMTLRTFERITNDSGLRVVSFRTNASSGLAGRALRTLAALPGCREYFTLNVYAVLTNPIG